MNNVYITNFQNAKNYGAALQCLALQRKISDMGYNVEVINYKNNDVDKLYKLFPSVRDKYNFKTYVKNAINSIAFLRLNYMHNKAFNNFSKEYLNLTKSMTKKEIVESKMFDNSLLVTGSDQVWNPKLAGGVDDIYFLNFGNEVKKISYAASIGTSEIDEKYVDSIKKRLEGFQAISVREKTAQKLLENMTNKRIDNVLDPTLLFTTNEWEKMVENVKSEDMKYIFVYMMNDESRKVAKHIAEKTGYKIVYVGKRNLYGKGSKCGFTKGPLEFVNFVKNAEYIVTTSFHATCFSIMFKKKFWSVLPAGVSSRITDLLEILGLSDRKLNIYDEVLTKGYDKEIDYSNADIALNELREHSLDFLESNLNAGKLEVVK